VVEVIDAEERITSFLPFVREIAAGALVTTEVVRIARSSTPTS
jgi:PII-like signaling protein